MCHLYHFNNKRQAQKKQPELNGMRTFETTTKCTKYLNENEVDKANETEPKWLKNSQEVSQLIGTTIIIINGGLISVVEDFTKNYTSHDQKPICIFPSSLVRRPRCVLFLLISTFRSLNVDGFLNWNWCECILS